MAQYVYFFGGGKADGNKDMKDTLGGKGAGLAEMTNASLPVPPGFTITTAACNLYQERGGSLTPEIEKEIEKNLGKLESLMSKKLGDSADPLLVSVRSGAKFSMPGMMDTILNPGLNDRSVEGLKSKTSNGRFRQGLVPPLHPDVRQRRPRHRQGALRPRAQRGQEEEEGQGRPRPHGGRLRRGDPALRVSSRRRRAPFPQDPREQLRGSARRRLPPWMNPRATTYRRLNDIPHDLGTAVNVQSMVFGNMATPPPTGVGFTRNPSTGAKEFYGEFCRTRRAKTWWRASARPIPSPT